MGSTRKKQFNKNIMFSSGQVIRVDISLDESFHTPNSKQIN